MELPIQIQATIGGVLTLAFFYYLWITKGTFVNKSKAREAPEPPGSWPIIGHLLQFKGPQLLFRTLAAMADKHGPALTIRFGVHRTLIISNWELAKEVFTSNDKALAGHPTSVSNNHLSCNYAIFDLASYGAYWREVRKLVVAKLLSNRRLESIKKVICAEVDNCIKDLYGLWVRSNKNPIKVEMNRLFRQLTTQIILRVVAGKRYSSVLHAEDSEELQRIQTTMDDFFTHVSVSAASDVLPSYLSWLDLDGKQRAMKKTAKELDVLTESWLQEHRQKRLHVQER